LPDAKLEMSRCQSCHAGFLPRPGLCPRCGSSHIESVSLPAGGTVLASTELLAPATGWTAPHRLAMVEIVEGIRVLCVVTGPTPAKGDTVLVRRDGAVYRAG
jgi:uncharacterized OB-fold protein